MPLPVEKQVLLTFAVTNGHADDVDVSQIGDYEQKLYDYFDANHADLMEKLKSEFSDEIITSLKDGLEKFKGVYIS